MGLFGLGAFPASQAGEVTYDFSTDPTLDPDLVTFGNGNNLLPWQESGGNPGGFLAVTYPADSQTFGLVFPDIDEGQLVAGFRFEADLRVGNSQGDRPADGFSISFARGNDPLLATLPDSAIDGNFAGGVPEGGSTTGIAICFDTWQGNPLPDGPDIEGIIVRVDNRTVLLHGLPTRHGECEDPTSLQTGPRDPDYWLNNDPLDPAVYQAPESWATLCWQPLRVELTTNGLLSVSYKGETILTNFQTDYFPSVGRLIFAGRTGGENEHTHVDNVRLTTFLAPPDPAGPPEPPSNLTATAVHARRVRLTWDPSPTEGFVAYEIERDGTVLPGLVTGTTFAENVAPGGTYSYRVRAVDASLEASDFVAAVEVTTPELEVAEIPGLMLWEAWTGLAGTTLDVLTSDPRYPDSPDIVQATGGYEGPPNFGDNYGARISGWIIPPESGNYVFFVAADDNAELYLSTDDDPANKLLIASETAWSNSREWTSSGGGSDLAEKRSDQAFNTQWPTGNTITLEAGQRYYTELLYKEGGGGDFGAVAIIREGDPDPANGSAPASGTLVVAVVPTNGPPAIVQQPASTNVNAGGTATFTVSALGTPPLSYQWQLGGTNLTGQTNATLTINNAALANVGTYTVVVSNEEGQATSQGANLTVEGAGGGPGDVTAPGDTIETTGGTSPGNEQVVNAIDNTTSKYLNFGTDEDQAAPFVGPVGLIVTPSLGADGAGTIVTGLRVYTANDAVERDPTGYTLEGSNDGTTFTEISSGTLELPETRNAAGQPINPQLHANAEVTFENTTPYKVYRLQFTDVKNAETANSVQVGEIELLGVAADGNGGGDGGEISIAENADGTVTITFEGTLQAADQVTGPFTDVAGATSPYTTEVSGTARFFRSVLPQQ